VLHRVATLGTRLELNHNSSNDAASIIRAVQVRNSLDLVGDAMRVALEALSAYWPEWMRDIALPHWYERYNVQFSTFRLPRAAASRAATLAAIQEDGRYLLQIVRQRDAPALAATLMEIRKLETLWQSELASRNEFSAKE
ncbi:MAG: hypothetical protein HZC40_22795, partial [Chloroflexi bacterium]|nr:hypothetical protein [Chloroflexota bacterium]